MVTEYSPHHLGTPSALGLAAVVVPLLLVVLIERELLAAAGRKKESRAFVAYAFPLIIVFLVLVVIQLRIYIRGAG